MRNRPFPNDVSYCLSRNECTTLLVVVAASVDLYGIVSVNDRKESCDHYMAKKDNSLGFVNKHWALRALVVFRDVQSNNSPTETVRAVRNERIGINGYIVWDA